MTKRQKKSSTMAKAIDDFLHSDLGSYYPLKIKQVTIGYDANNKPIEHPLRVLLEPNIRMAHAEFLKKTFLR